MTKCHCSSGQDFAECCGPRLDGRGPAATAEALMRSRYSAFVVKDFDYLIQTHDPLTLAEFDLAANQTWARSVLFTRLEVLRAEESGHLAVVEFRAHFIELATGRNQVHHEVSDFRRENLKWYFVRGR